MVRPWRAGGSALALLCALGALLFLAAGASAADTDAPMLASHTPADGAAVNRSTFRVTAVLSDNGSGINSSSVQVSFEGPPDATAPLAGTFSLSPTGPTEWTATFEANLSEGAWAIVWDFSDVEGNRAQAIIHVAVDFHPPALLLESPALANASRVTLRIDVTDLLSGPRDDAVLVTFRRAGDAVSQTAAVTGTTLPGRFVGEFVLPLKEGYGNSYTVTATDRAGNTASRSGKVTMDSQPPTFSAFEPPSYSTVERNPVTVRVFVNDALVGVNASSIEAQFSNDGGVHWGPWTGAETLVKLGGVSAGLRANFTDGALAAVRWRASDFAGNGPNLSTAWFFRINGPPFLISFEPPEGAQIPVFEEVVFRAEFADPDADAVAVTFASDRDGLLGRGSEARRTLSPGYHNITVSGDDQHGHQASYVYSIRIVPRPPPDLRLLVLAGILAGAMTMGIAIVWTRPELLGPETDDR